MADKAEPLKKLPGFTMGVRQNSAVRMVKLASPICPYSKQEMERTPEGRLVPKKDGNQTANCQLAGGEWWKDCEARGHDPYYHTRVWYTTDDQWETDEHGNQVLTGQRTLRHEERQPNFVQCPVGVRYGGANDPYYKLRRSMQAKGRRPLKDIGYEDVCDFRNCQNPVLDKYRSRVGNYCSREHLALVAADWNETYLIQMTGQFETGAENAIRQKRERQLREAVADALA